MTHEVTCEVIQKLYQVSSGEEPMILVLVRLTGSLFVPVRDSPSVVVAVPHFTISS